MNFKETVILIFWILTVGVITLDMIYIIIKSGKAKKIATAENVVLTDISIEESEEK